MRCSYSGREEHVEILVKQVLIDLIAEAEALQKLVSQSHHLVHPHVALLHSLHGHR